MQNPPTHLRVFLLLLAIPCGHLKADPFIFGGDISAHPNPEKLRAGCHDN